MPEPAAVRRLLFPNSVHTTHPHDERPAGGYTWPLDVPLSALEWRHRTVRRAEGPPSGTLRLMRSTSYIRPRRVQTTSPGLQSRNGL